MYVNWPISVGPLFAMNDVKHTVVLAITLLHKFCRDKSMTKQSTYGALECLPMSL